jgi:UDP-N-acetylmuramate--alanine ligase
VVDGITIIDDYGHHPVEISAVLKSARDAYDGRIIAVVQPHRYSRMKDLFEDFCTCFNNADAVIVAPVHAAGEAPIEGFDRDSLVEGLRTRGHRQVTALETPEQLVDIVGSLAEAGDMVVCLGAGTITNWANALPEALAAWRQSPARPANDQASDGGAS